jgi:Flp pilus assembly protein TadG
MTVKLTDTIDSDRPRVCAEVKQMHAGGERGQSMVEFALVVPILLMLVTAIVSFGIVMQNSLALTNGVNIGAQQLAMSRGQTTDPCATASAAIESAAPNLSASSLSFTFVINGSTYSSASCTAGAANMAAGASAQVTVTYPCSFRIYGTTFPSCTLTGQTAEMIQ